MCFAKENLYPVTFMPDFYVACTSVFCGLGTRTCSLGGSLMCFAVTGAVFLGPLGATDISMIRATITAFF